MSPEELVALTTSIAIIIAKDLSNDELTFLITELSQIHATLGTILAQRILLALKNKKVPDESLEPITDIID